MTTKPNKNENSVEEILRLIGEARWLAVIGFTFLAGVAGVFLPLNPHTVAQWINVSLGIIFGLLGLLLLVDKKPKDHTVERSSKIKIQKMIGIILGIYALAQACSAVIKLTVN